MLNKQALLQIAEQYDSFYLYDENVMHAHTQALKAAFAGVDFLYSIKANPFPPVVRAVFFEGLGADAASVGEVELSLKLGLPPSMLYYSAPAKSERDIRAALGRCVLIADSLSEIAKIDAIAAQLDIVAEIGVRINPDFTFYAQQGAPSKFGVDESAFFESMPQLAAYRHVRVTGIHVHARSQELNADVLLRYYKNVLALAQRVRRGLGVPLQYVNMGSGIGVPYSPRDAPLDISALGAAASELFAQFRAAHPGTALLIETGRFAVCKCGVYVSRVLDKKTSCGKTFVLLSNTLNGFIKPSVSRLIAGYASDPAPGEPLFTGVDAHEITSFGDEGNRERVTLSGNLCTAIDVVAQDALLPRLQIGDIVAISNAGSYAAAISPMQFSSQTPPAQLLLARDGAIVKE